MIEHFTPPSCAAGALTVLQGFIHSEPMKGGKTIISSTRNLEATYRAQGPAQRLMNMSEIIFFCWNFLDAGEPSMPELGANAMNGRSQPRSGSMVSKRDSHFWAVGILDHIRPGMDRVFRVPWRARLEIGVCRW